MIKSSGGKAGGFCSIIAVPAGTAGAAGCAPLDLHGYPLLQQPLHHCQPLPVTLQPANSQPQHELRSTTCSRHLAARGIMLALRRAAQWGAADALQAAGGLECSTSGRVLALASARFSAAAAAAGPGEEPGSRSGRAPAVGLALLTRACAAAACLPPLNSRPAASQTCLARRAAHAGGGDARQCRQHLLQQA